MILFCRCLAVFCLPWLIKNLGMQDFLVLQRFQLFFVAAKKWKVFIRLIFDKKNSEIIFSFLRRNEKNLRCYEEIFQRKKKFGRIDSWSANSQNRKKRGLPVWLKSGMSHTFMSDCQLCQAAVMSLYLGSSLSLIVLSFESFPRLNASLLL